MKEDFGINITIKITDPFERDYVYFEDKKVFTVEAESLEKAKTVALLLSKLIEKDLEFVRFLAGFVSKWKLKER